MWAYFKNPPYVGPWENLRWTFHPCWISTAIHSPCLLNAAAFINEIIFGIYDCGSCGMFRCMDRQTDIPVQGRGEQLRLYNLALHEFHRLTMESASNYLFRVLLMDFVISWKQKLMYQISAESTFLQYLPPLPSPLVNPSMPINYLPYSNVIDNNA